MLVKKPLPGEVGDGRGLHQPITTALASLRAAYNQHHTESPHLPSLTCTTYQQPRPRPSPGEDVEVLPSRLFQTLESRDLALSMHWHLSLIKYYLLIHFQDKFDAVVI